MIKLQSFQISGFRGIKNLEFTMQPGKALLLHGLNGTGKSSLHQALTFAFTGYLPPVVESADSPPARVFRHAALDNKTSAWVKIEFSDDSTTYWIKREIHQNGSVTAQSSTQAALDLAGESMNGFCFITRRQFASMVDAVERDRWNRLTPFLGHDQLSRVREGFRSLALQIRRDLGISETERDLTRCRQTYDTQTERLGAVLIKLGLAEFSPHIASAEIGRLIRNVPEYSTYDVIPWDSLEPQLPASTRTKEITRNLQLVSEEQATVLAAALNSSFLSRAVDYGSRLDSEPGLAHSLMHTEFIRASQNATRQLSAEACPLCALSPVNWEEVRASLSNRAATLSVEAENLREARDGASKYAAAISDLAQRVQQWCTEHEPRAEMLAFREEVTSLKGLVTLATERLALDLPAGLDQSEREVLDSARKSTANAHKVLRETLTSLRDQLVKEQEKLPGAEELRRFLTIKEASGIHEECLRVKTEILRVQTQLKEAQQIADGIQALSASITDAESDLSTTLLTQLESEVRRIFCVLTDNQQLQPRIRSRMERGIRYADIEIADFYGLGTVSARDYLSEANRNSLGLAIYFAGLLRRKPQLGLLVIDDITHSADNAHRRGLAQFIANDVAAGLQLMVLTHDDNWHARLKQTLPANSWVERQVINWSPDGLIWKSDNWTSLLDKAAFQIGHQEASGGNTLRQALEQFMDDACERYDVLIPYRKSATSVSLNEKRQRLEKALKDMWASGDGIVDPNSSAVRLLVHSQQITNLSSHYGSFESWSYPDLVDTLQDVRDVIALFSCKNVAASSTCGGLLPHLRKQGGAMPTCKQCKQPITL